MKEDGGKYKQAAIPHNSALTIGDVFTPIQWGIFAIEEFGIFEQWLTGASVFDPTMGEGFLLQALVEYGLQKGYTIEQLPLSKLYGNELNTGYYTTALKSFQEKYAIDMQGNFWNVDILRLKERSFDIVFGNPPWQNFVDLPDGYKEEIKQCFFDYDLVGNSQKLLLGGARIDIAALIIQRVMQDFLVPSGNAYFFMPLSILLNDGANEAFRKYKVNQTTYAPKQIIDFNNLGIFEGVATRYGLLHFQRDATVTYPIPYKRNMQGKWQNLEASPLLHPQAPLSILAKGEKSPLENFEPIPIPKFSTPRQGINTCGANGLFFFGEKEDMDGGLCKLDGSIMLPSKYIFPLLTSKNFTEIQPTPKKWVLLPYQANGKPLEIAQIKALPSLWKYLAKHKEALSQRKGRMINAWIKRGYWWALLGIGPYSFASHKIVWEAYGKKTFKPIMVDGNWQANQSLQAFIPTNSQQEADRIFIELSQPAIEAYLLSLKMEGTMNWAQPGKIKPLLSVRHRQQR